MVVGLLKRVGLSVLREGEKAGDEPGPHVKHLLRNLIFCTFGSLTVLPFSIFSNIYFYI